jgi:hypothetical protein
LKVEQAEIRGMAEEVLRKGNALHSAVLRLVLVVPVSGLNGYGLGLGEYRSIHSSLLKVLGTST